MALRPTTGAGNIEYGPSVTSQAYVPQLFAKKALKNFYQLTVFSDIANTDYQGEIKSYGDKVYIRTTPVVNVQPWAQGADLSYDGLSGGTPNGFTDARELNIDQGLAWDFLQEDADKAQSDIDVMNLASNDAAKRMAIAVDRDVLEFIAIGDVADNTVSTVDATGADLAIEDPDNAGEYFNVGPIAGAISKNVNLGDSVAATAAPRALTADETSADYIIKVITECAQVLDEADQPQEGRWMVLPAWACALLKQSELRSADITGDGSGVIRTGLIGMVDNFKIYRSNNGFTDKRTATLGNFYVPFGTNEGMTFASQLIKTETLRIEKRFGDYFRGLQIYGRAIVQPKSLGLLYCTKA